MARKSVRGKTSTTDEIVKERLDASRRMMSKIRSKEDARALLVKAGIYTKTGGLAKAYRWILP